MKRHLSLPELSGPQPHHMHPPAESGAHHASLPLPCRCSFLVRFLKSILFLPPSPLRFPPSQGKRWIRLSAQPSGPQRGGTAGLRGAEGTLTDSTDNHCNKFRVRKVGGKQLFPKCHHCRPHRLPPLCWYCSQRERNRKDWGSENHRKERGRITGGDAYWGLARLVVGEDKSHSSSSSAAVKYLLWLNVTKHNVVMK